MGGSIFHHVDKSGTITKKTTSPDIKFINGGGMLHDPETGGVLLVTNGQNSNTLYLYELDAELGVVERRDLEFAPSGQRAYWPQGFIRVNEHFVVVGMARSDSAGWSQDTGDVWLAVLDKDFQVLETHQVTQFEVPEGAMRPSVSRNGDTLLVTFDRLVRPNFVKVTIDLKAFGLDGGGSPGDTDLPADDSAPGGDDTSGGGGDKGDGGGGCGGCATGGDGGVSALAALLGLAAVRRRR
jgi:MYXO-CTERM domain-containing protein